MRKRFHSKLRGIIGKVFFDERIMLKNIFEFCQNEMLIKQRTDFTRDDRYQFYKEIHNLLNIKEVMDSDFRLCRVGKEDDGGYVMALKEENYSSEKIAYSIGICDDVSWDLEIAKAGYQIYQYDHTIKKLPCNHESFHWKKIGLTGGTETKELKRLKTVLAENGHDKMNGGLLKIDVEGYEWEIFAECEEKILKQFDQIVMELHNFHDLKNRPTITKALKNINNTHQVIYVHCNNMSPVAYCGDIIMPNCLEVIYVKKDKFKFKECEFISPTSLDRPNLARIPEIKLGNWNLKG